MTKFNITFAASSAVIALSLLASGAAQAANECKVGYGYKSGSTNKYTTVYISAGQTKTINRTKMRYVQNKKSAPVKIRVTRVNGIPPLASASGTKYVSLPGNNNRDPLVGNYFDSPATKLYSIKCEANNPAAANPAGAVAATTLYNMYFALVKVGAAMKRIHPKLRTALIAAGVNATDVNNVRIGYSPYLAAATGKKVAMTDCNYIYFPRSDVANAVANGSGFKNHWWLLHEMGHTMQCRTGSGRPGFATRWFNELPGSVKAAIASGQANPDVIHDAMPLEQQADGYANRYSRAFQAASR